MRTKKQNIFLAILSAIAMIILYIFIVFAVAGENIFETKSSPRKEIPVIHTENLQYWTIQQGD